MIQKKFLCKDLESAQMSIKTIGDIISSTKHKCALVTFYEKGFSKQDTDTIGDLAARKLVQMIERPKSSISERIVVEGRLLEGGSVRHLGTH